MQRTRDAMVAHLVEMLSKQSILSKCYDTLPSDKASSAACLIETEAFSTAVASASTKDEGGSLPHHLWPIYSHDSLKSLSNVLWPTHSHELLSLSPR